MRFVETALQYQYTFYISYYVISVDVMSPNLYFLVGSGQHGMMMNQGGMQMAGQPRMMIRNIGQQPAGGNLRQVANEFKIFTNTKRD